MIRRLADTVFRLPRHPFALARALVREPILNPIGPRDADDLPAWTDRFPILICHNHQQIATGIHAQMVSQGWRALICHQGAGARELCENTPISLVILGPVLPDIAPYALIESLWHSPAARAIPVLALVARGMGATPAPPRGAMWLDVPFERDQLVDEVRLLLLVRGNWRLPPGYHLAHAQRALKQYVAAR